MVAQSNHSRPAQETLHKEATGSNVHWEAWEWGTCPKTCYHVPFCMWHHPGQPHGHWSPACSPQWLPPVSASFTQVIWPLKVLSPVLYIRVVLPIGSKGVCHLTVLFNYCSLPFDYTVCECIIDSYTWRFNKCYTEWCALFFSVLLFSNPYSLVRVLLAVSPANYLYICHVHLSKILYFCPCAISHGTLRHWHFLALPFFLCFIFPGYVAMATVLSSTILDKIVTSEELTNGCWFSAPWPCKC